MKADKILAAVRKLQEQVPQLEFQSAVLMWHLLNPPRHIANPNPSMQRMREQIAVEFLQLLDEVQE